MDVDGACCCCPTGSALARTGVCDSSAFRRRRLVARFRDLDLDLGLSGGGDLEQARVACPLWRVGVRCRLTDRGFLSSLSSDSSSSDENQRKSLRLGLGGRFGFLAVALGCLSLCVQLRSPVTCSPPHEAHFGTHICVSAQLDVAVNIPTVSYEDELEDYTIWPETIDPRDHTIRPGVAVLLLLARGHLLRLSQRQNRE
ncbi:hypothetical protein MTO96_051957 [Rhipicephalus appendiculatus]